MPLRHYDRPDADIRSNVAAAMQAEAVDPYVFQATWGKALVQARRIGGHITRARVTNPHTNEPQELVYCEANRKAVRLRASHVGCPADADGFGLGNKHGAARYMPHYYEKTPRGMVLIASLGPTGVSIERDISLSKHHITIHDSVTNLRHRRERAAHTSEATSILNHLYLPVGNVALSADNPILINGETIDDIIGQKGAGEHVHNSQAVFWPGFAGLSQAAVTMPDGSCIAISAGVSHGSGHERPVDGALLWAPPDHQAFCLEPVIGMTGLGQGENRGLIIGEGETRTLRVSLRAA